MSDTRELTGPWDRVTVEDLTLEDRRRLIRIAWDSIESGLEVGKPRVPDAADLPEILRRPGAAFVTLQLRGELRGCVGSFEPRRPLFQDVAQNAYSAAFMDHRFPPLAREELPDLHLHISLLGPLTPLAADSRREVLQALRPGLDGLLLEDPPHRAIFLPQVWKALPDPEDFLAELFRKAGLPRRHWSSTLRFHRYEVAEV